MKVKFQSLLLLIILSVSCQPKHVTADLELDPKIKEIIHTYQEALITNPRFDGTPAKSIDIIFYGSGGYSPACILVTESGWPRGKLPFLVTIEDSIEIRVYSPLMNLFQNRQQFFINNNIRVYEEILKEQEDMIVCGNSYNHYYSLIDDRFVRCDPDECCQQLKIPSPPIKYRDDNKSN